MPGKGGLSKMVPTQETRRRGAQMRKSTVKQEVITIDSSSENTPHSSGPIPSIRGEEEDKNVPKATPKRKPNCWDIICQLNGMALILLFQIMSFFVLIGIAQHLRYGCLCCNFNCGKNH